MRKTLAVAMIVKNEEVLLSRCLDSCKGADAIYILDTGSQDNTISIARQYTDNVFTDFIWNDSFCQAQNHLLEKIRGKEDFILSIDADEVLLCGIEEVIKTIQLAKDFVRCFMIAEGGNRLEFEFARLFRNTPDIYWCQDIHKHLNLPGAGELIGNVRIMFGWSPAHNNDPDRALRILEKVVREEGDAAGRNLYYLGREYWYKQRAQECIDTLWRYVRISNWDAEKAESFLIMSQAYSSLGYDDEARNSILQAIKLNPHFKEAIMWMGGISTPEDAKQWYRMARTADNRNVLWDRMPAKPVHDVVAISVHNDDESLFLGYTLMRHKPLVIIVTDGWIQYNRGDMGTYYEIRRQETIAAMKLAGCPVVFLGIKDTELTEDILRDRLQFLNPETVYIPASQGGNAQHDLVNKVALELFGRHKCEQYSTYTKTQLYVPEGYEIKPTHTEMELKNKMLDCYKSQLQLPSTKPHFDAVRNQSEWLI